MEEPGDVDLPEGAMRKRPQTIVGGAARDGRIVHGVDGDRGVRHDSRSPPPLSPRAKRIPGRAEGRLLRGRARVWV